MKKIFLLLVGILILGISNVISKDAPDKDDTDGDKPVSILCSPDLYEITKLWVNDYCKLNPGQNINVITGNPEEFSGLLETGSNLGFISNRYYQSLENRSLWKLLIGRDVTVPIINSKNPFIEQIHQKGISSFTLAEIFKNPDTYGWELFLENGQYVPVKYYMIDNESIQTYVSDFINTNNINVKGIEVYNGKELITAVQNDPYGLGFCKLTDIIGPGDRGLVDNIMLLPIDRNGNGQIDYFEKIYDNLNDFSRGIWIGKYPKTLISNLYSVANSIPENETEVAFLKWVITDGQQILEQNGYSELLFSERQSKLEEINDRKIFTEATNDRNASYKIVLLIIIVFVMGGIIVNVMVSRRRRKFKTLQKDFPDHPKVINENSLTFPNGLYFDKTHTWAFMEKNGIVKVGIDDFLQHITGNYTRVKMKEPGEKIKKNEQILSLVQNGKHLNIYSPISGTIRYNNETLVTDPSLINSSPYDEGWLYMIEPSNWLREIQFLKMAEKYKEWLKNEFSRLKNFLSTSVNAQIVEYAHITLQDGGELKDNVLMDLGPKVWEDFQKNFIDTSE